MNNCAEPLELSAPSSKSMSHRALLVAGLARGTSRIGNVLKSDDLKHTRMCLESMGIGIADTGSDMLITGIDGKLKAPENKKVLLDVGESGTTCRLIAGIVAAGQGDFEISGRGRMHQRPIKSLDKALTPHGISFTYHYLDGCPPVTISSNGLSSGEINISLEDSSQYLSGILLGATMARDAVVINIVGEKVVSWPYVDLTLQVMGEFGLTPEVQVLRDEVWRTVQPFEIIEAKPGHVRFIVSPGVFMARDYQVEGDFSNASYLLAAGAISQQPVLVKGLNSSSRQGDRVILDILRKMGARVEISDQAVLVEPGKLQGVELDMGACPDLVPTVAVLASLARGRTRITNVAHLKIKESDRLGGVYNEISRTGCRCEIVNDGLIIEPENFLKDREISFCTYDDHRMAMSLSLYELVGIKVVLDNSGCVNKSFPGFFDEWAKIRKFRCAE